MNQTEIDELRRLHEAATPGDWHYDDGVTDGEGTADAERGKDPWLSTKGNVLIAELIGNEDNTSVCTPSLAKMDANGRLIERSHNALPRLLAALEEARAERGMLKKSLRLLDRITDGREQSNGTDPEEIQIVVERFHALKAERDKWEGRAKERAKTSLEVAHQLQDAESLAWDALGRPDGTHDTSNVQRLCEAHGALKAKLAALASACSTWQEWGGHCDTCEFVRQRAANPILDTDLFADYCDCGWHATRVALAAAKVQP